MPAATTSYGRGSSAGPDDLDDLLDYDEAVQDFWKDMPEANGDNANESNNAPEKDMDEEVKVAKKRKPNPKLDQDRYGTAYNADLDTVS
jgi:replication fork protection complex subunit Csm3/Swi3